jgi:hypothetical protein
MYILKYLDYQQLCTGQTTGVFHVCFKEFVQVIRHDKYTSVSLNIFLFLAADMETLKTSFIYYMIFKKGRLKIA